MDITSTMLRKIGASGTMDEDLAMRVAVQAVMTHKRDTAAEHYQILKKTQQAAKGHGALARKLGIIDSVPTIFEEDSKTDGVKEEVVKQQPVQSKSPCKKGLSENQLEDIDLLLSDIITTNAAFSMTQVKNLMSESVNLIEEVDNPDMVKRVYKRVKYLQENFDSGPQNIPEADDAKTSIWIGSVNTSVSAPSRRYSWSKDDVHVIEEVFKKFSTYYSSLNGREITFKSKKVKPV